MMKAALTEPDQIDTSVKSESHSRVRRRGMENPVHVVARQDAALSGRVVRIGLPRP